MSKPDSVQKLLIIFLRLLQAVAFVLQNNRLSSTKKRHRMRGLLGQTLTPIPDFGALAALTRAKLKTFMQRMKR